MQPKKTVIPEEVIETLQKDVAGISHGSVVIKIEDSIVVGAEVNKKRKFTKK